MIPQFWNTVFIVVFSGIGHINTSILPNYFGLMTIKSSSLQLGWKWNPKRYCWGTNEDTLDCQKPINPLLKKFSAYEIMSNIPEQWKRFNLANRRDCVTMVSICDQPIRAMAIHLKLNNRTNNTTAFDVIEKSNCRRVMLRLTSKDLTPHQNDIVRENRHEHLRSCETCFATFTRQIFYNTSDRAYGVVVLYEIYDASCNGIWVKNKGIDYFYTDDCIGVSPRNNKEVGTCIQALTGFNRHQGRIASNVYAVQHCVMDVNYTKTYAFTANIDIKSVHKGKLGFFGPAIMEYFVQAVWTDSDKANNYLRAVGEVAYKYLDVSTNVAKVNSLRKLIAELHI